MRHHRICVDQFPFASQLVNELMAATMEAIMATPVLRDKLFQVCNFQIGAHEVRKQKNCGAMSVPSVIKMPDPRPGRYRQAAASCSAFLTSGWEQVCLFS